MLDEQQALDDRIASAVAAHEAERPTVWTGHLVVYGRDPERSAAFYEQIGMRPIAVMAPFAVMELRGGTHLVIRKADDDVTPAPVPFDLMVEDLPATRASWQSAGIPVSEVSKDDLGIHNTFTVTDPDGNTIVVNDSHVVGPA